MDKMDKEAVREYLDTFLEKLEEKNQRRKELDKVNEKTVPKTWDNRVFNSMKDHPIVKMELERMERLEKTIEKVAEDDKL